MGALSAVPLTTLALMKCQHVAVNLAGLLMTCIRAQQFYINSIIHPQYSTVQQSLQATTATSNQA